MSLDPATVAAILGMALATYACRGGGYWLFTQIRPTKLTRAVLGHIPGALFISYVAPALVHGGLQTSAGAVATLAAMVATGNLVAAIAAGTAAAWLVWSLA